MRCHHRFITIKFLSIENLPLTPRISNGGLLVVLWFVFRTIARVSGQVIALNSATAHTRKRCMQWLATLIEPAI